jgi:bifunctional non-homologous end joining protein LigD
MGKVGTGVPDGLRSSQKAARPGRESEIQTPLKKPKAAWVEIIFTAEVKYLDITSEGPLRQSSFKGLKRT